MNIDKVYQKIGIAFKRIFYIVIRRPIEQFNIDNRAQKKIANPTIAPWHETTQRSISEQLKKNNDFANLDSKNNNLLNRLKSIKIDQENFPITPPLDTATSNNLKRKALPENRFGLDLPHYLYKPAKLSPGKITVLDVYDIILSHRKDNLSVEKIAEKYSIDVKDIEKILKYIGVFKAIDEDREEVELFVKKIEPKDSEQIVQKLPSSTSNQSMSDH
ncbi:hypothetical protein NH340_JMT03210 [Sarcoptes scabiei]|nr:hypothetical protein NH340_JMT03210 [Sarcoptes scabiei]